ncbi:MAG: hypothetical protein HOI47_00835 [Candidatus Scalindua sp.]|jgi:hypothetical protein|nr:hypothetical protein [Candidatus Scalindua sp.]
MDFKKIRRAFKDRGMDASEFEEAYNELTSRIEESVSAVPHSEWEDPRRTRDYSLVLRQVLLHRTVKLFSGSLLALLDDNIYSMVLSVRGHFETTAALGYLHYKLNSLSKGNLVAEAVGRDISIQLLGSRDKDLLESAGEDAVEAKQILTMLEYADKSVSKHFLQGTAREHAILTESYEYLCEFCHPNYHSNSISFELNKEEKKFDFMYNKSVRDREFRLIEYLLVSNEIFVELYDMVKKLVPQE